MLSIQEYSPLEGLQTLKASPSAGVVTIPKETIAGGPPQESGLNASSGTLATHGHHVAFSRTNESKRVRVRTRSTHARASAD